MAKTVSLILAVAFLVLGLIGFVAPTFLGTHLTLTHNLIHLLSAALAFYFGTAASLSGARMFCFSFGIVYGLLGVSGLLFGQPQEPNLGLGMGTDPRLLVVIPGQLELGIMDHMLHVLLGVVFLISGLVTKTHPAA